MSRGSSPSSPASKWGWAPWGLGLLLLALGFTLWEVYPPGIWHDDGVYVLLGRSLAQGEGLRYVGVVGEPLAPKFPPLYSLLLAGVWVLFPTFPDNLSVLDGLNLVLLSGGGTLFAFYLRRGLSLPLPLALGITTVACLSPHLWRFALVPLSEPLFLLTLVAALWAGARAEGEGKGWGAIGLFVVAGGMAAMTRTLGVAVLLAGAVSLASKGRLKGGIGVVVGSLLVLFPWVLWTRMASATVPGTLQDTLGPYAGWWVRQMVEEPGASLAFMLGNGVNLTGRVLALLLPGVSGPALWVGLLLLPVLLLGLWEVGRRSRILPLALAFSLGILLLWPFQDIRLVVPLHPLLVLGTLLGFRVLLASPEASPSLPAGYRAFRRLRPWAAGLGGGWVLLVVLVSTFRLATGWPGEPFRTRSEALVQAVRAVRDHTPPSAVVGAPELWSGIHLFTGRTVAPSAPFFPLASSGPTWGSPREQYELWDAVGLTHIVVEHGGRVHGEALTRMDTLCPGGAVQLLDNRPGQFLVGLAWDQNCKERVMNSGGGAAEPR